MESTATETYTSLYPMNYTDLMDSNSSGSEEEEENYDDVMLAGRMIGTLYMIITIIGIVGNGTVIYVVLRFAKMKTVTNCYILNLAVADALFVTFLTLMAISNYMNTYWIFGAFLCKVFFGIDLFNMVISVWSLTAMSVDRYVAVCHAMKSRSFRNLRVATAINSSIWVLSILASIPFIYFAQLHTDSESLPLCYLTFEDMEERERMSKVLTVYTFTLNFVVPLTIIIVCYANITLRLRDMNKKTGKPEKSRKVNRLVLIVVITFVVCWCPFYIVKFCMVFAKSFASWEKAWIVSETVMSLSYINSCANPFLYAFFSDNFRKSFKKAWFCTAQNRDMVSQTSHASRWKFGKNGGKGKSNKKGRRFRLHDDEGDDNISGINNQYPLTATAVTSVVSESSYPRNGEMVQIDLEKQAIANA